MSGDRRTNLRAIGIILVGFVGLAITDALMKFLSGSYQLPQTVFFNALFSLVPIAGFALWQGGPRMLATRRPGLQLLRGLLGLGSGYGAFFAFARMPLADVYAILFSSPLIITVLSALFFRERVDARRWLAVLVGFGGVLVMLRPTEAIIDTGAMGAIVSALCFSSSALLVRHWGRQETTASFPFYGNLLAVLLLGPVLPQVYIPPAPQDWALMALCGLSAGVALLCLLTAFRIAPSPVVAPFQYSQIVWGVLIGLVVFGDVPSPWLALGTAIVVGSGLYLLRREAEAARQARSQAAQTA
ncbi:DMT family transporter [Azospirillum soli]|uniref:DMT family transporter n=1 Tax=Azospirillum soli TaxID=1304799 RepID=UPI001AEA589C|nr:DMT family transporter [Azospirillum soli]MBP2311029.1 drug/metabolite transporter (DMT)-like permease [Azospirillum soli]